MAFPPLPDFLETPWYDEFVAWAAAAESTASSAKATADSAAAREYWGQGRPDVAGSLDSAGTAWVAAATAGAVFRSTDGPQGAWTWRKRASSGWDIVDADTGWIAAAANRGTDWADAPSSPTFRFRRRGLAVQFEARVAVAAGSPLIGTARNNGSVLAATLPAGFGPAQNGPVGVATLGASGNLGMGCLSTHASSSAIRLLFPGTGNWTAGDQVQVKGEWDTNAAYPVTI